MAVLRGSCLEVNDIKVNGGALQYTGPREHLPPVLLDLYENWHRAVTQLLIVVTRVPTNTFWSNFPVK